MESTREVHKSATLKVITVTKKQNSRTICDGNQIYGNQRQEWEMFELMPVLLAANQPPN